MKIRIKFARGERVKFLGHLDIMRSFQRAFIRAGIQMVYSIGFNPHQKMNFAQPLGVGVVSCGDYLDAEVADGQLTSDIMARLNAQMGEGFEVLSVHEIPENAAKGMAAVRYASYIVTVNSGACPATDLFLASDSVITVRRTKSGEKETDIRPFVISLNRNDNKYNMTVTAGSENNLKPDLLMQVLFEMSDLEYDRNNLTIMRTELYAADMIPLERFETADQ